MKKINSVILIFILTSLNYVLSQESAKTSIFLDENTKPIEMVDFYEKNNSFLYYTLREEKDSLTINYLVDKYKFGKLLIQLTP